MIFASQTGDAGSGGADLVVGGTGMAGRMLARAWKDQPGAPEFQYRGNQGEGVFWDPMSGPGALYDWCGARGGCRTMIVLAGVTIKSGADYSENAPIAEACLRAAETMGVGRVLYASTSAVYGRGDGRPFHESDTPNPANAYGEGKVAAEAVCAKFREAGLPVTVLRIGNIAGAEQLLMNASNATPNDPLKLDRFSDGKGPRRCYIGAGTMTRVLDVLRAAPDLPPVLNVGAPRPVAMEDLVAAAGTHWVWVPAPTTAIQDLVLDCSALERLVTFTPEDSDPAQHVAEWQRYRDPQ